MGASGGPLGSPRKHPGAARERSQPDGSRVRLHSGDEMKELALRAPPQPRARDHVTRLRQRRQLLANDTEQHKWLLLHQPSAHGSEQAAGSARRANLLRTQMREHQQQRVFTEPGQVRRLHVHR